MSRKKDFFEDMAVAISLWIESATKAVSDMSTDLIWTDKPESFKRVQNTLTKEGIDREDIQQVFSECFQGLAISFLTIIDGGTALAEKGRVYLVDQKGTKLGEGLHDEFVEYLMDTGRLD